jgi:5'-nucleotidase
MYKAILISFCLFFQQGVLSASEEMTVLLTNDDGYLSEGISVLHGELTAAGYDVTVVAPLNQQSASGMKVSLHPLSVVKHSPNIWSVEGTPADAMRVALANFYKKRPPDYVVSGPNFGQNLGSNVMISGTVAAAIVGTMEDITSVALSVGLDLNESNAEPIRFPSTVEVFHSAAKLLVQVLDQHQRQPESIPKRHVLNINYPLSINTEGPLYVSSKVSDAGGFGISHGNIDPATNVSKVEIFVEESTKHSTGVDAKYFSQGKVTFSLLKPDWNAADADVEKLNQLVRNLNVNYGER